jgi:hypothetical protein
VVLEHTSSQFPVWVLRPWGIEVGLKFSAGTDNNNTSIFGKHSSLAKDRSILQKINASTANKFILFIKQVMWHY